MHLLDNGKPLEAYTPILIRTDPFVHRFSLEPETAGRLRVQLTQGILLSTLTNPIYYAPGPPLWAAARVKASTLGDGVEPGSATAGALTAFLPALGFLLIWRRFTRLRPVRSPRGGSRA